MFSAGAGCVFMGIILHISGIQGQQQHSICALKGSSVDLPCSAHHNTSSMTWYTVPWSGSERKLKELSADESRMTYNMSDGSNFTLTINNLTESDANVYCCKGTTVNLETCKKNAIRLCVTDLQVKVLPTTEGQTVTLMCSTSCALTETPAVYIWYKNRESLYQDGSPWYQELVSSEEAVRYSCAIKGYEDLRAPEVSVDSVTSTCFTVSYAKGGMCSYYQTSEDESCSITYPREVHVQRNPATISGYVTLTCNTNCPPTAFIWYRSRYLVIQYNKPQYKAPNTDFESFSCAVKGFEDLHSSEVCAEDGNCPTVNYVTRRICALQGSSVNISSKYDYFKQQPVSKLWYKIKRSGEGEVEEPVNPAGRVEYHENMRNHHILKINRVKKDDSAEYIFKLREDEVRRKPGVTLVVTGLKVKFAPSAVVTEDQRVTLTCSTSCPLTNTNYIWFFNGRPLTLTENQNKHLVLDPVSSQHAGKYSCAVKTQTDIRLPEETLTVLSKSGKWTLLLAAGVCAPLLVIIILTVILWIRKKRSSSQLPGNETPDNMEQLNPVPMYENLSAQPTEQEEPHYRELHFSQDHQEPLYSTLCRGLSPDSQ